MASRRIAGVAAGVSDFLGIDVTLIRVLFILLTFFTGSGLLIYLILWLILPQDSGTPINAQPRRGLSWVAVLIAVVVGAGILTGDGHSHIVGLVVIIFIAMMAMKLRGRKSWKTRKEFEKARLAWQRRLDEHAQQTNNQTYLGGNSFQIGSFYTEPSPDEDGTQSNSGFQIQ